MMSMKKTVVAIATVAVAQTAGVQADDCSCCFSQPKFVDPPVVDSQIVEKEEEPTPAPEPTPVVTPLSKPQQCKKFAKDSKDACVEKSQKFVSETKSAFRSTKTKAVKKTEQGVAFAKANPVKCASGCVGTVALAAGAAFKGNVAFNFVAENLTKCGAQLKVAEQFDAVKTIVTNCFTKTADVAEKKENTIIEAAKEALKALGNKVPTKEEMEKMVNTMNEKFSVAAEEFGSKVHLENATAQKAALATTAAAATGATVVGVPAAYKNVVKPAATFVNEKAIKPVAAKGAEVAEAANRKCVAPVNGACKSAAKKVSTGAQGLYNRLPACPSAPECTKAQALKTQAAKKCGEAGESVSNGCNTLKSKVPSVSCPTIAVPSVSCPKVNVNCDAAKNAANTVGQKFAEATKQCGEKCGDMKDSVEKKCDTAKDAIKARFSKKTV